MPTIFYSASKIDGRIDGAYGFQAVRATSSRRIATSTISNPPGWLPVPIGASTIVQLPSLPINPRNSFNASTPNSFYYTFACRASDLTFELNARLEVRVTEMINDGGNNPNLYEVGTAFDILPGSNDAHFYE